MHTTLLIHHPAPHLQVLVKLGVLLTQRLKLGPGGGGERQRVREREQLGVRAGRGVCFTTLGGNGRQSKVLGLGPALQHFLWLSHIPYCAETGPRTLPHAPSLLLPYPLQYSTVDVSAPIRTAVEPLSPYSLSRMVAFEAWLLHGETSSNYPASGSCIQPTAGPTVARSKPAANPCAPAPRAKPVRSRRPLVLVRPSQPNPSNPTPPIPHPG